MRRATTALRALLAGGCIAFALPPWGWWPFAFVGFALFAGLVETPGRWRRFRRGWLVGVAWMAPSTVWILDMSAPAWPVAVLVLGAYVGAAAALVPARRPWTWLALPAAVALAEFARTVAPFGGVPLSTVAMTQAASPLGPVARVGGGVLLTLVTVAAGTGLAALAARHGRALAVAAAAVVGLVAVAAVAPAGRDVGTLDIALVQGGGPQRTRAVTTDANLVFQRHLVASAQVEGPVDLVVWPENVVSVDGPFEGSTERADLVALARRLGAPVVPGIVESFPGRFYNASVVLLPDGTTLGRYDKVRRVPFGEYVPFRATVDALSGGSVSRLVPSDAVAGTGPAIVETPEGLAGIVISWEVFFERRARDAIGNGGEILLNPTNGSSYWLTIVQSQQVASSRLRALETGRWVLQTAPTGFTAVVGPDGTVHQRTGVSEAAVLQQEITRRQGLTWSVRFGPWPALAVAGLLLLGAHLAARRDDRPAEATAPTDPDEGRAAEATASAPTG
ncbi:MAG: apolipoprotein N-acyltransferase [Acidimicrobiales bacterium]